jgi:EmrB/QacA subfamily drug resistance transporter
MRRLHGNPWAVLATLCLGFFMTLLDTTIVNVAIPNMLDELDGTFDQILWVLNSYTLVFAVLVLLSGRLGDVFGARNMLIAGLVLFTVASVLCGVAQNTGQLIAFRAVQGLGAAFLMPQTLALLTAVFPAERRGAAFGVWSAIAGVAPVAGPVIGGALVTGLSWRWIFLINVPLGVLGIVLAFGIVPNFPGRRRTSLGLSGVVLSTSGLLLVVYGLIEGQRYGWGTITSFISIPLVIGVGLVLLALFVVDAARHQGDRPLLPFALFRVRNFPTIMFVTLAVLFSVAALLLPLTVYLQSVLGLSALGAGLVLAPPSVVQLLLAPVAGKGTDRTGGKYILLSGLLLFGLGFGLVALMAGPGSSWPVLMPGLLVAGAGMGAVFAAMNAMAMKDVPLKLAGAASGVVSTARQLGMVLGSAAVGALLQNRLANDLASEAAQRSAQLPPEVRPGFVEGFAAAGERGLQVGAQQSDGLLKPLPGLSADLANRLTTLASQTFDHAYTSAMRVTILLPVAVLLLAGCACLLLKRREPAAVDVVARPATETSALAD